MSTHDVFINAILALDENKALDLTRKRLESGEDPARILNDMKDAVEMVGEKFEAGEFFTVELIMAGEILREITEMIKPKLAVSEKKGETAGRIVIGTVKDDIHNIGKDIVKAMLEAAGFEVVDLGVDVPPSKFVEAVKQYRPHIVGMSGLLTISIESMKVTVDALKEAGLRNGIKIIIGGGRMDELAKQYTGADAWTNDASTGVRTCLRWVKETK
ncbi:MAG: cobalamin-dependent protein [Candidatus Bathyarchaeia archaeon]